jgi:hypothetical protein
MGPCFRRVACCGLTCKTTIKFLLLGKFWKKRTMNLQFIIRRVLGKKIGNHGFTVKDLGQMYFQKNTFIWLLLLLMKVTNFVGTQKG